MVVLYGSTVYTPYITVVQMCVAILLATASTTELYISKLCTIDGDDDDDEMQKMQADTNTI